MEGTTVTDPSNYDNMYFNNIKALVLVNLEYTNPTPNKPAINVNSEPADISSITKQNMKSIINPKKDIITNIEPSKEIKGQDDDNKHQYKATNIKGNNNNKKARENKINPKRDILKKLKIERT